MLKLISNNTELEIIERKYRLRIKMRRIEEILLTCFSVKRMQILLSKSDVELDRARIKNRIKRLIRLHHECRLLVCGNYSSIGLVHSRPLDGYELLKMRVRSGNKADDRSKYLNKQLKRGM